MGEVDARIPLDALAEPSTKATSHRCGEKGRGEGDKAAESKSATPGRLEQVLADLESNPNFVSLKCRERRAIKREAAAVVARESGNFVEDLMERHKRRKEASNRAKVNDKSNVNTMQCPLQASLGPLFLEPDASTTIQKKVTGTEKMGGKRKRTCANNSLDRGPKQKKQIKRKPPKIGNAKPSKVGGASNATGPLQLLTTDPPSKQQTHTGSNATGKGKNGMRQQKNNAKNRSLDEKKFSLSKKSEQKKGKHMKPVNNANATPSIIDGARNALGPLQFSTPHHSTKQQTQTGNDSTGNGSSEKRQQKETVKNHPSPKKLVCNVKDALAQCIVKRSSDNHLVDFPKEQITTLPDAPYEKTKKPAVLVTNAASSDIAVTRIRNELFANQRQMNDNSRGYNSFQFLGFDTETRPKFHKGGDKHPPALIQLATATTAYLFRLTFQGMSRNDSVMTQSLRGLLSDQSIIKIGVGIHPDVKELKQFHGPQCCGDGTSFLDLRELVTLRWQNIQRCGLRNLAATLLRFNLSKKQQMKNWEMKKMTRAMEAYAAADAFVALDLLAAILG